MHDDPPEPTRPGDELDEGVIADDPTGELAPVELPQVDDPPHARPGDQPDEPPEDSVQEFRLPATRPPDEVDERDPPMRPSDEPMRRGGLTTVVVQGLLGGLVLFLLAANPWGFTVVQELLGFGLIAFGTFEAITVFRKRQAANNYLQPAIAVAAGGVLIVWPDQSTVVAGYVLATVVAARGVLDVWAGLRRWHEDGANAWVAIRGLIQATVGALMMLFPAESVALVVVVASLLALARAIVSGWFVATHRGALSTVDPSDTYGVITYWLSLREMDGADADAVEDRVYLQNGEGHERYWRFAVLTGLATAIATFGIATDSTAVVIGAMLVAPLMTPILGTAAGLINGSTRPAAISGVTVLFGSLGSIALAFLLSSLIPDTQAVIQNAQVTTRTAPSILDLAIALAAGAAGAYGVSRAESSDALPGVAVAIALVPPLAVVGITLHSGDLAQASGALLLFLTNLFSILLMAGIVFVMVGYGSWNRLYRRRNRIRVSFAAVILAVILITIPLALTARSIVRDSQDLRNASAAVEDWLGPDTTLRIADITVDGDAVTIQLIGPVTPPPAPELSDEVSERVGREMTAIVRYVLETEVVSRSTSSGETAS